MIILAHNAPLHARGDIPAGMFAHQQPDVIRTATLGHSHTPSSVLPRSPIRNSARMVRLFVLPGY